MNKKNKFENLTPEEVELLRIKIFGDMGLDVGVPTSEDSQTFQDLRSFSQESFTSALSIKDLQHDDEVHDIASYWKEVKAQDKKNLERLENVKKKFKQSKQEVNNKAKARNKDFYKTAEGLAASLGNQMKASSKRRGFDTPSWNTKIFRQWLFSQDSFDSLFNTWSKSGHLTMFKPTIKRIDTNKGYHLDNMRVVFSKDKKYEK